MKKIFLLLIPLIASCNGVKDAHICQFKDGRQAAVSLTFDDGLADDYFLIAPQLNRLGMHGTFWICASNIGTDDNYSLRLTWDQCREMAAAGHEISNHSWSHPNLTKLTEEQIREEVKSNDDAIERELGARPVTFCYPFNASNETVSAICSEGRVGTRTFQEAQGQANSNSTPESLANWLRKVIDNREWGVTMTHGIHSGWDQWEDENVLWSFYKELNLKRDSVWVDTFAAVSSYIQERDNCTIKASLKGKTLTITPSCSLDPSLFKEPLTAAVTLSDGVRYFEFDPFGGAQTYDLSNPLAGKVINVIGDSYVRNHARPFSETWHYKAAHRNGMIYNNYGINGSSIAYDRSAQGFGKSMLDRYVEMRHDADYILVIAGHNDAFFVARNPEEVEERVNEFFRKLSEDYAGAKIGYVTPWRVNRDGFTEITTMAKAACEKYGIKVFDTASPDFVIDPNDADFREKYFQGKNDTAHLTSEGHDLVVDAGEAFIKSL